MASALLSDLRVATRVLRRQPAVTALLLVMLALGVAANVTVFSLVNGLFLRPLPFPEAERLVYLNEKAPRWNLEFTGINYPDFHRWREGSRAFSGLALYGRGSYNLADGQGSERVEGAMATHDLLDVLGLVPALGRGFTPEEDRPGGPPVLTLGYDTWKSRFGGDPSVLGRPVRLDGVSREIVGVLPPEAIFPSRAAVWVPVAGDPEDSSNNYWADGVARLKPGVTLEAARQDLLRAHEPLYETRDKERQVAPRLMPLRERYVGVFRATTLALGFGVALVLLVACANVAGISLARACARQREVGVRIALGAGLGRLARQLLAESLLLSTVGSLAGLVLGQWACRLLVSVLPERFPAWVRFDVDARVLAFCRRFWRSRPPSSSVGRRSSKSRGPTSARRSPRARCEAERRGATCFAWSPAHGLRPACAGLALGLLGALGMSRVLASLLAGLSPFDLPTFATAAVVLLGTALVAALLPARRVASVSPQVALREE